MSTPNPAMLPVLAETHALTPRVMRWGFGAVMCVIVFITALSFWRVEVDKRAMNEIISHEQVVVEMLYRMQLAARDRTFALFGAVHANDPFVQDSEIQRFFEHGAEFRVARAQLTQLKLDETERALLRQLRTQTEAIAPLFQRVIEFATSGRHPEAEKMMIDQVVPAQTKMVNTLTALLEEAIRRTHEDATIRHKTQNRATALLIVGGLAGLLLTWGIFVLAARKMSGLISRLTDASERLQASNLDPQFQKLLWMSTTS